MSEMTLNNAVAENPDANRLRRISEAQTYHSPVEEKIRSFERKVSALDAPAAPTAPQPGDLENFVGPDGVLRITVPVGKKAEKKPVDASNGSGGGNEPGNAPNASGDAQAQNAAPSRRSVEMDGGTYVIEDRAEGPTVIARQPGPHSPIKLYDQGIPVDETMLLPPDERTFTDKALQGAKDLAVGAGDAANNAMTGIGLGEAKLVTNTIRTLVDNPIGEYAIGEDGVKSFVDLSNRFLTELDKAAGKQAKTKAGKITQAGGEIAGQFVMPTMGAYSKIKAMGANPLAASLLAEGGVAVFGINPDDPNLSDLIPEDSKFAPIRELLGTDPDDSAWANRAKNAAETFALLGVGEAGGRAIVKGIEEVNRFSKDIPGNVMNAIDRVMSMSPKQAAGATAAAAAGAVALTPEQAEANARTEVLQKAISLLNDVDRPAGQAVIKSEDVKKMIAAADAGTNPAAGIDFNLSRIENGEQLGSSIDQLSEIYKDKIFKGKRGVQSFDMTQTKADMSREMGFDVEAALSRQPGELWPDYKIKAARDMFVAQVEKTRTMALAIKQPGGNSEDALLAFRREMAVTAALQMQIKGAQTEVARALSQFRMTARSPLEARVQVHEIIETAGGSKVNEEMVDAFINAVENGGPDAAAIFARQANNATSMEMLYEAWINSLLGSPQTHIVNVTGNSLAGLQGVADRYAAAGYGAVERTAQKALGKEIAPGGITLQEANAYANGLVGSTMDAFRAFGKALKTGTQSDAYGKLDYHGAAITAQNVNELPIAKSLAGRFGKDELIDSNSKLALLVDNLGEYYYRLPGRFLMAEDDFFKTLNYRAELHARIEREAGELRAAGRSPDEIEARRLEILQDPQVAAPDIHLGSIDQMREQTFTAPPGPVAGKLQGFLNEAKIGDFPAGRIVVPFFNVINNITKYTLARTPGLALLNPKSKTFQDLFSGDPARRQMVMGKWTTGGSIMGTAAYLNMNGVCTGRLTDNPKLRAQMEAQGKKPYSCIVTMSDGSSRSVQYNRLDPIGMSIGIATTTAEVMHYTDDEETREMLGIAAVSAILPYMEEKSYFSGMADFMNALMPQYGDDDARVKAMSRYVQNLAASAPGALLGPAAPGTPLSGWAAREIAGDNTRRTAQPNPFRVEKDAWGDDVLIPNGTAYRTWEGVIKRIMSRTPGLSDNLPARKNLWGENQVMENGIMSDGVLSPLYSSELKYDTKALKAANLPDKAKAGYFYGLRIGQDMTPGQFSEFVNIVGIDGELERLGAPISMPRKQISARNGNKAVGLPVDLNDRQYADYLEMMNGISVVNEADPQRRRMNMKQALDWFVKQPEYAALPDDADAQGSKGDMLRSIAGKYRDAATNLFLSEDKDGPALTRRSIELKLRAQNTGAR